jgi:hypothetical protein
MIRNVGSTDKVVRIVLAIILVILAYMQILTGTWMYVAYAGATILVLTSVFSFCGLYTLFGMNTCNIKESK